MKKLYIGNFPFQASTHELRKLFLKYGEIVDIALVKDKFTGHKKGFGFIVFSSDEEAKKALEMDGFEYQGRLLRVSFARQEQESSFSKSRNKFLTPCKISMSSLVPLFMQFLWVAVISFSVSVLTVNHLLLNYEAKIERLENQMKGNIRTPVIQDTTRATIPVRP